jgi:hypothetical protein
MANKRLESGINSKNTNEKKRFPRKNGCHYCSIRFRAIIE